MYLCNRKDARKGTAAAADAAVAAAAVDVAVAANYVGASSSSMAQPLEAI